MNNKPSNRQTIIVQNKISDYSKLSDFLNDYVRSTHIADEIIDDLRLVLEETFVNIASYAFSDNEPHTVTIEFNHTADTVSLTFTDTGIAFNPITGCNKNIENENHCEGGMGIHIIMSLTDSQKYDRIEQRNVFTVTKHYTK